MSSNNNAELQFQLQPLYGGAITTLIPTNLLDASQIRQVPDTQEVFVNLLNPLLQKEDSLIFDLMERVDIGDVANTGKEEVEEDNDHKAVQVHLDEISDLNNHFNETDKWKLIYEEEITSRLKHFGPSGDNKNNSKSNDSSTSNVANKGSNLKNNSSVSTIATAKARGYLAIAVSPVYKWGRKQTQNKEEGEVDEKWLVLVLGLIRHKVAETDIVITLNLPALTAGSVDELKSFLNGGGEKKDDGKVQQRIANGRDIIETALENFLIVDEGLFG